MRARFDGRLVVLAVLCAYFGIVLAGGSAMWERLRVPVESPSFLDMRSITTAWECRRAGIDPLPRNPCDPRERPANYPRLWQLPSELGLGESATVPLAVANAAVFLVAALLVVGRLSAREGAVVAVALCSPAVMLGIERGNVDLTVFAVIAVALLLLRRGRLVAGQATLLLAALLKLFPALALATGVGRSRRTLAAIGASMSIFLAYVALTFDDVRTIRDVVPQEIDLSYGAGVLADAVRREWDGAPSGRVISLVVLGLGVAVAVGLSRRARRDGQPDDTAALTAFRAGAAIYLGTYALLHDYDYRLSFLVLTLPLLLRDGAPWGRVGAFTVVVALVLAARHDDGSFPREELVNWALFVYLGAALLATLRGQSPNGLYRRAPAVAVEDGTVRSTIAR